MRSYFLFLENNFKAVFFGWIMTFYSSFGQTFLISLYVPFLLVDLGMSKGAFGTYYAIATIIAALSLLRLGHLIDEQPIKKLSTQVILLLAFSCGLLALAWHPAVLFVALIGLRLAGQGLLSHISLSVMSRYFDADRGKALSLSSLGYSMGEMIFPAIFVGIIALSHWRVAGAASVMMVLGLLLILPWLRTNRMDIERATKAEIAAQPGKRKFYWQMIKTRKFWVIATPSLATGFAITGFFFYQFVMAESKGWSLELYTMLFTTYGGVRLVMSIFGGSLTDKVSAVRLFPWILVPVAFGMLGLALSDGLFGAASFLIGTGISMGLIGVVKTAVLAEVYGIQSIGRVRSLFSVVTVFSTAIAPMVFGLLLDRGVRFESIALGCVLLFAAGIAAASQIGKYRIS